MQYKHSASILTFQDVNNIACAALQVLHTHDKEAGQSQWTHLFFAMRSIVPLEKSERFIYTYGQIFETGDSKMCSCKYV